MTEETLNGWREYWFVIYRSMPTSQAAIISKNPRTVQNPSGKRAYPDEDIIFSAQITEQEAKLGPVALERLYKHDIVPGTEACRIVVEVARG